MFEWLYSVLMSFVTWVLSFFGSNATKNDAVTNSDVVVSSEVAQVELLPSVGTKVEVEAFNEDNEFTKPTHLP